jgi:FkbM family methyltransferase
MIVNRFDRAVAQNGQAFGVGYRLLSGSSYEPDEAAMVAQLLDARREYFGDGVNVLDIGANIGVFTIEWAKHMTGWGQIVAFEAQERLFHALCGNVAINNCFNARTIFAAVTSQPGMMRVPVPNYFQFGSFGSLELRPTARTEDIGQPIDYSDERTMNVPATSIDAMGFRRLDLLKVDVEGMELEVLEGARDSIGKHHPIMVIEKIKTDEQALRQLLTDAGYRIFESGINLIGVHPDDPTAELVRQRPLPGA